MNDYGELLTVVLLDDNFILGTIETNIHLLTVEKIYGECRVFIVDTRKMFYEAVSKFNIVKEPLPVTYLPAVIDTPYALVVRNGEYIPEEIFPTEFFYPNLVTLEDYFYPSLINKDYVLDYINNIF